MAWQDRLKEPAITTPDGLRYIYEYTDVEKETNKKTSVYIYGDTPGASVQDFGVGEKNIPLTMFFSGPDYDLQADAFEESAGEPGISVLEHPIYGIKDVTILSIKRQDALVSAGGQAVFTLVMTETLIETIPVQGEQTRAGILGAIDALNESNALAFAGDHDTSFLSDAIASAGRVNAFVKDLKKGFKEILNTVQAVQDQFNAIEDFINNNIDFLLGSPLLLASAIQRLINSPARIAASVGSRIGAYLDSYDKLLNPASGTGTKDVKNQRQEKQLITVSIISAIAEANLFADSDGVGFLTKSEALENASFLIDQLAVNQEFLDNEQKTSEPDSLTQRFTASDTVSQDVKNVVALTAKNLISLSFSLKQERIKILEKPENFLPLCFKLYGTTANGKLDFFIDTNKLTGKELIEIPIGREIRYYV